MQEYLKEHGSESVQAMAISYYMDLNDAEEAEILRHDLFNKFKNRSSYGSIGHTANYWYLCDYFGNSSYRVRARIEINGNEDFIKAFENEIKRSTFRSPEDFSRRFESFKSSKGQYYNGGANAEITITTNGNVRVVGGKISEEGTTNKGRSNGQSSVNYDNYEIEYFTNSIGEIYGFIDKEGNMYLDETKINLEHPIHEYTHLWDRAIAKRNPKLWEKGVELLKQFDKGDLWIEIANDANYGKQWIDKGIAGDELDNLIASEVHARLVGENGAKLIEDIAKKEGLYISPTKWKDFLQKYITFAKSLRRKGGARADFLLGM